MIENERNIDNAIDNERDTEIYTIHAHTHTHTMHPHFLADHSLVSVLSPHHHSRLPWKMSLSAMDDVESSRVADDATWKSDGQGG